MYATERQVKSLERRIEVLEHIIEVQFADEISPREICAEKGHVYRMTKYDLQGGKWGKERCERCGDEYSWSV